MKKQRYFYLDNICAVLILHMIFVCHQTMFCDYSNVFLGLFKKIFGFFMAWFFFKGGMMFKNVPVKQVVKSSSKRLLLPYAIFTGLGLVILALEEYFVTGYNPITLGFMKKELVLFLNWSTLFPTMACWFLLSLFVVRITFALAYKKNTPPILVLSISVVLGYLIYYLSVKNDFSYLLNLGSHSVKLHIPFYIGNMFLGLFFYALGHYLKEKQLKKYLFVAAIIIYVIKFIYPAPMDFRANDSNGANYFLAVLYMTCGCVIINNIFHRYLDMKVPLLTYIGSNSMIYYLVHYPVMVMITTFLPQEYMIENHLLRYFVYSFLLVVSLCLADFIFHKKYMKTIVGS